MAMDATVGYKLPRELTDIIFSHLRGDIRTLKACSLVSSIWLPSSRLYLFENVVCSPIGPSGLQDLILWVCMSPSARLYVKSLNIRGPRIPMSKAPMDISSLFIVLPHIPNLENLFLYNLEIGVVDARCVPTRILPRISNLTFEGCMAVGESSTPTKTLLSLFQEIQFLTFDHLVYRSDPLPSTIPTQVHGIAITCNEGSESYGILQLFSISNPRWDLRLLHLSIVDFPYSRRPLDTILPLCRNTLRELQVDLMVCYWSLMDALLRFPKRKSFLLPKACPSLKR